MLVAVVVAEAGVILRNMATVVVSLLQSFRHVSDFVRKH